MSVDKEKLRSFAERLVSDHLGGDFDPVPAIGVTAADVLSLLAEIDQLRESHEQVCENYNRVSFASEERSKKIDKLQAENEDLRKDAERYRWISKNAELESYGDSYCLPTVFGWDIKPGAELNVPFENLDQAIDQAIRQDE